MQTINVKGIGHVSMPPDTIIIKIQIDAKGEDLQTAKEECTTQLNVVKKATIEQLGIKGISAEETRLYVEPTHLEDNQDGTIGDNCALMDGFKFWQDLSFRFPYDMKKLRAVINALVHHLPKKSIDVFFTVEDQQSLEDAIYEIAAKDAECKAEIVSKIAGKKLGSLVGFRFLEEDDDDEVHVFSKDSFRYNLKAGPISIDFKPTNIDESATIEYAFEIG